VHDVRALPYWAAIERKDLVLTVSPGRSGTKLLARLLGSVLELPAEHEPEPRANWVLRPSIEDANTGREWLLTEKLPSIACRQGSIYIETSHIYCKGMIEIFLSLGLKLRFIILRRRASEVARSLYQMGVIPGRTKEGVMVLLSPSDCNVLPLEGWEGFSDYQLCYWYAREIERRQMFYSEFFTKAGISFIDLDFRELIRWEGVCKLHAFLDPSKELTEASQSRFLEIVKENQNPRGAAHPGNVDRILPQDLLQEEMQVDDACAPYNSFVL
jgi:hypothetical protein